MMSDVTKIPNFLIVGAAKSGTSSLHSYLSKHPDIFMPEKRKELYFWHVATNTNRSIIDHAGEDNIPTRLDEYLQYFEDARKDQITGEACPSYLYFHDHVLKNLKQHHANWKDVKVIIILREPVSRIISQYRFVCKKRLDPEFLSFSDALEAEADRVRRNELLPDLFYTDVSKYVEQVEFYLKYFNNVHVCLYDDLKEDPRVLLDNLCDFLGVDSKKLPEFDFEVVNASIGAKKLKHPLMVQKARSAGRLLLGWLPERFKVFLRKKVEGALSEPVIIPEDEVGRLREVFQEEIKKLETTLDKDLSFWVLPKK
ncbi:sulfotransferase domain-containing protein [Marinobacter pelagius]|uniref:Sulfotransferase domain-containing protein n=1 Tax=Marinobacter pelagius TaxID=379482 RepID=A0A1I4U245_9GAMM|nr:sulfotransferase domain-containing protein [Marinobacter pelagius]SFM82783.1 Sulfotransferase domain-containing protein [Marinobacter pelagius]